MKITVKFLKSTGTHAIFRGAKNCGSNYTSYTAAVVAAQKKFPGETIAIAGGQPAQSQPAQTFAEILRPLVERIGGAPAAAALCGVTRQTVNLWLAGSVPNAATQRGAVVLIEAAIRLTVPAWEKPAGRRL